MNREQAINYLISRGFTHEQVGDVVRALTYEPTTKNNSSELEKNSKKLEKPQTFKWCTDCKEYDQEKHCCHRWSKVIRDTVEEMKQEPRKGYWLHRPHVYGVTYCSVCDFELKIDNTNYCPHCGARMAETEVEDGNDD